LKQVTIRIALKTGRKLGHFCTAFVVHFYTALDIMVVAFIYFSGI
jgi:hypothetical protein